MLNYEKSKKIPNFWIVKNRLKMKKINIENILCAFIILCPILDIVSFLYRNIEKIPFP